MALRIKPTRFVRVPFLARGTSVSDEKVKWAVPHTTAHINHKTPYLYMPNAQYAGRNMVTMLPGGGIGPEMMKHVRDIFAACHAPVDFEVIEVDPEKYEDDDMNYAITSIKRNKVAIKGNIETKSKDFSDLSRNITLRSELDLFVNVLHCKSLPGIPARFEDIDLVLIRQNTDGEYAMLEHEPVNGVVESMKVITRESAERVSRFSFEIARRNRRRKVTTVHKANIMKFTDGLFLKVAKEMSKQYPDIEHNDMIVDNTCMQMVTNPYQFDVLNMPNLYGSIIGQVVCGLINGGGVLSGRNYGDFYAVFEPGTRNSCYSLVGTNTANPIAMLNSAIDMLLYLGYKTRAQMISEAIAQTVVFQKIRTPDLGGECQTTDIVENIIEILGNRKVTRPPKVHKRRTMYELW